MTMLAVPIEVSYALETIYSFLLFSAIIAVPFFFSGIAICICLTRSPYPIGQVYFVDLLGAAAGCFGAVAILSIIDAPSAMLAIGALLFVASAAFAIHAGERGRVARLVFYALLMVEFTSFNSSSLHGLQPIWSKGRIDARQNIAAEAWNAISRVRIYQPGRAVPEMWGPSPRMPPITFDLMHLDIDNDASTPIYKYKNGLKEFDFLRYDVTSFAYSIRKRGSAAIIGVGGGRDALAAAAAGFNRIVGIEVNCNIIDFVTRRLGWFTNLAHLPGLELHCDEGRSYLSRTREKFDIIQASMVDTWAATSAGAMTLSENSLYTVDGWEVFYNHLKPGGMLTFSRWSEGRNPVETLRMFAVGWATLLQEGVPSPGDRIALVNSRRISTLLLSNRPFSAQDIERIRSTAQDMEFTVFYLPGRISAIPELRQVAAAHSLEDLSGLRYLGVLNYSPVYDSAPFFFNFVRLRQLRLSPSVVGSSAVVAGNVRALAILVCFMIAALFLLIIAIGIPLTRWAGLPGATDVTLAGGALYFVSIGLGFMLIEMSMMQQLSLLLGQPIYSLVLVLVGLILSSGFGSLASERLRLSSSAISRMPALVVSVALVCYATSALPLVHRFVAEEFWVRALISLALITPCGFLMGFCFLVGLRWMRELGRDNTLAWMWALNGAASVLATFVASVLSMQYSIAVPAFVGAAAYLVGALALPWSSAAAVQVPEGRRFFKRATDSDRWLTGRGSKEA
jgi:spermidine synthase